MKIKIDRTVVQHAIEALESCSGVPHWPALQPTIADLREALAAPTGSGFDEAAVERALVTLAWHEDGAQWPDAYSQDEQKMEREKMRKALASPQPAQQEPVAAVIGFYEGEREPRLLSWNRLPNGEHWLYATPQPAPQQAPDALHLAAMDLARKQAQRIAELEQQLAARGPLTDEQIKEIFLRELGDMAVRIPPGWRKVVCAIEAAHGITKGET